MLLNISNIANFSEIGEGQKLHVSVQTSVKFLEFTELYLPYFGCLPIFEFTTAVIKVYRVSFTKIENI